MFQSIFTNAGEFRSKSDSNSGMVFFGKINYRKRGLDFEGASPDKIEKCLHDACDELDNEGRDPIENAFRFYQKFVYTHPFYDGNGRIARLIVNIYLMWSGYYVYWSKFNKIKFIKKLNQSHKRKSKYEEYIRYFVNFCNKNVMDIADIFEVAPIEELDEY